MPPQQFWTGIAVVILGYIVGFYFQRRDFEHLNKRIDDLRSEINARFDDLKDLLRSEIKRIEDRIERLEHPVSPGR